VLAAMIASAIGGFFEAVEDTWNNPLNPLTWF
jgi:hypothetical protein